MRTRDANRGLAYEEWKRERAVEIEQENTAAQAAQAAAIDADPIRSFAASSNRLAEETRSAIMSGQRLSDDVLQIERTNGSKVNEQAAISNFRFWANNQGKAAGFQPYMADTFLTFVLRQQDGAPTADTFSKCFQFLKDYNCLQEAPAQPEPELSEASVRQAIDTFLSNGWKKSDKNARLLLTTLSEKGLTASLTNLRLVDAELKSKGLYPEPTTMTPTEISEAKYKARLTEIVVYDPLTNIGYSEFDLEHKVDSKTELRLRRLMEGNIGDERYTEYMNRQDYKAQQAAETNRIAADEAQR